MRHYWAVRLGEGGRYLPQGRRGNFIAIGWNELGDLSWLVGMTSDSDKELNKARIKLAERFAEVYVGDSAVKKGINIGQIFKFVGGISQDDVVLVPDSSARKVHIASVSSAYQYAKGQHDDCPYLHRHSVVWIKQVNRDSLPPKLRFSMGSLLTVFSLDRHRGEIDAVLTGTPVRPREHEITGAKLTSAILDRLYEMEPRVFEHFLANLLQVVGFEASTTQLVGDKGIDVVGSLNAEGLARIDLRVQAKKKRGSIGIDEVLKIRGALAGEEQGAIITTSKFTKQALQEAQAPKKSPIAVLEGSDLVGLILEHYNEIDPEYQEFLGLKKKQVPLTDVFYIPSGQSVAE